MLHCLHLTGRIQERRGALVTYINSTLGEHCVPGPLPMQLDKSKEWTGGVGMVLEWYYVMMPSGHVASPALRMEREDSEWPQLWVTDTATSCQSGSEWGGLGVRARLEHLMTGFIAVNNLSVQHEASSEQPSGDQTHLLRPKEEMRQNPATAAKKTDMLKAACLPKLLVEMQKLKLNSLQHQWPNGHGEVHVDCIDFMTWFDL